LERGFLATDFLTSTLSAALIVYSAFQLVRSIWNSKPDFLQGASRLAALLPPRAAFQVAGYLSTVIMLLAFAAKKSTPFIYFQF
jgi:hypothetical protein